MPAQSIFSSLKFSAIIVGLYINVYGVVLCTSVDHLETLGYVKLLTAVFTWVSRILLPVSSPSFSQCPIPLRNRDINGGSTTTHCISPLQGHHSTLIKRYVSLFLTMLLPVHDRRSQLLAIILNFYDDVCASVHSRQHHNEITNYFIIQT